MLSFAIGAGGTMPLFVAEVIPAIGVGVSTALQWGGAFLISNLVPKLEDKVSVQQFIIFFIACNIIAFIVIGITCIETKGLTEKEISDKYAEKTGLKKD
jgi:Sugar (and other) transporter